jgi:hypothetical protein
VRATSRAGVLLLLLVLGLATAGGGEEVRPASPVIEGVRIGTAGGQLRLEVIGSERLSYLVVDSLEPPTLSLFFANTAFAFPAWSREFADGPLRRVSAVVLGRSEGLLARIDLEFARPVAYQFRQSDRWLVVSADVAGPPSPVVVGSVEAAEAPPELLASSEQPAPAPAPAPAPPPSATPAPLPTPAPAPAPARAPAAAPAPSPPAVAAAPAPAAPAPAASPPAVAPAPTPPAPRVASVPSPARIARVRRISPAGSADEVRVTVESDGPLTARAFVLADPPRLVVDFENTATDLGQVSIPAGGPLVARVRSSQLRVSPTPVVRVVLDLLKPVSYRVEPHAGGATIRVSPGAAR